MSLLDFGATRGFDESFTDVYVEVKSFHYYLIKVDSVVCCGLPAVINEM